MLFSDNLKIYKPFWENVENVTF